MKLYALIMAGGEGKRFWPASRKGRPKQFLTLSGEKSMIRETVERILPLIPIERVFVVTLGAYADETRRHLPELPEANLLLEPRGRNTGPCIVYGALRISSLDPDAVLLVLPADHAIGDASAFADSLAAGAEAALGSYLLDEEPLITFGITPARADTGYGYIRAGALLTTLAGHEIRRVDVFAEKPDYETACRFVDSGGYYWNSGIFMWKAGAILREFKRLNAKWGERIEALRAGIEGADTEGAIRLFYSTVESGSVDKLVLEGSRNSVVMPVAYPWSDLGSWEALDRFLRADSGGGGEGDENIFVGGEGAAVDSARCFAASDGKYISLVGVSDLAVVCYGDSVLVVDKKRSQDVKKLIAEVEGKKPELL